MTDHEKVSIEYSTDFHFYSSNMSYCFIFKKSFKHVIGNYVHFNTYKLLDCMVHVVLANALLFKIKGKFYMLSVIKIATVVNYFMIPYENPSISFLYTSVNNNHFSLCIRVAN